MEAGRQALLQFKITYMSPVFISGPHNKQIGKKKTLHISIYNVLDHVSLH